MRDRNSEIYDQCNQFQDRVNGQVWGLAHVQVRARIRSQCWDQVWEQAVLQVWRQVQNNRR